MFSKKSEEPQNKNLDHLYFSVYDSKVGFYNTPFLSMNEQEVLRDFENMMQDPEQRQRNKYYLNSEDFQIFSIGFFNKITGAITSYSPRHVANLHEVRSIADRKVQNSLLANLGQKSAEIAAPGH